MFIELCLCNTLNINCFCPFFGASPLWFVSCFEISYLLCFTVFVVTFIWFYLPPLSKTLEDSHLLPLLVLVQRKASSYGAFCWMIIKPNYQNTSHEHTTAYSDTLDALLTCSSSRRQFCTGKMSPKLHVDTTHVLNGDIKLRVHPIFPVIS